MSEVTPGAQPEATPDAQPRGWWRRNRWALLALPLVLVVVTVSGAGRLATFWWPYQLHDRVEGVLGEATAFADTYRDAAGTHGREVTLTVTRVTPDAAVTDEQGVSITGEPLTPGTRIWGVEFTVEADPETVLSGCQIALVDAQGRSTPRDTTLLPWQVSVNPCEPADSINPQPQLFVDSPESDPSTRPPTYTRSVQLALAEDFEPVEVRLWWEPPTVLAVPLPDVAP